ncbi:MAG: hypothetical protein V4599_13785 [Verrucomicrobiota bacterium]
MAVYYTFYIECYHEQDAVRIHDKLQVWTTEVYGREVSMARVLVEPEGELWYVYANPKGPGYSPFGYGEGLNEPETVALLEDRLYELIASEVGIRRALCGYEAQDVFRSGGDNLLDLDDLDVDNLVFDRNLQPQREGVMELGCLYYRTRRRS